MRANQVAKAFGEVLRDQRDSQGLTQEKLALDADVDRTFVSQMERGIRQPTLTTLFKLSEALKISPAQLVKRTEKYFPGAASSSELAASAKRPKRAAKR